MRTNDTMRLLMGGSILRTGIWRWRVELVIREIRKAGTAMPTSVTTPRITGTQVVDSGRRTMAMIKGSHSATKIRRLSGVFPVLRPRPARAGVIFPKRHPTNSGFLIRTASEVSRPLCREETMQTITPSSVLMHWPAREVSRHSRRRGWFSGPYIGRHDGWLCASIRDRHQGERV